MTERTEPLLIMRRLQDAYPAGTEVIVDAVERADSSWVDRDVIEVPGMKVRLTAPYDRGTARVVEVLADARILVRVKSGKGCPICGAAGVARCISQGGSVVADHRNRDI